MDDIASLISLLSHADPHERVRAALALEDIAMPGRVPDPPVLEALRRGIPIFVAALKDSDRLVRLKSVRILGQLGPLDGEVVAAVAELLQRPGEDSVMRDDAMTTLGLLGPAVLPVFWQMWLQWVHGPRTVVMLGPRRCLSSGRCGFNGSTVREPWLFPHAQEKPNRVRRDCQKKSRHRSAGAGPRPWPGARLVESPVRQKE